MLKLNSTIRLMIYMITCSLIVSCGGNTGHSSNPSKPSTSKKLNKKSILQPSTIENAKTDADTDIEVMNENDISFNGKLKRYFTLREFNMVLGEPDSTKLLSEIEPCTNIFEEPDGSVHPEAKYLYKNGSRFECSQGKVAIDEVKFSDGDFIIFNNLTLSKNTTLVELKEMFPKAAKKIGVMNVFSEGNLQVMQLKEDNENISDGHINLFIKNGRLYSLHWWFPC